MLRWLYSLIFVLALPLVFLRVWWRARKEPRYAENAGERLGIVPQQRAGSVWVHAVSAGETIAASGLVRALVAAGHRITLTNMTPAGRERAEALFSDLLASDQLTLFYAPYDVPFAVKLFLHRVRPRALFIIDTELWPNTIALAAQFGLPVYLVNGRLSEKSAAGYGKLGKLATAMFSAITTVFAQSEPQAERFRDLGSANVKTVGSVKFDAQLPADFEIRVADLVQRFADKKALLAASTHEGEEDIALDAFQQLLSESDSCGSDMILVLAPRHIHRVQAVQAKLSARHLVYQQHSKGEALNDETRVYLIDTMGELIYFYGVSSSALVGGSLIDVGGHNPMEPGMLGKPMCMGPFRRNIADIAELFAEAGALEAVENSAQLANFWRRLDKEPELARAMSDAALKVMVENRGALQRVLDQALPVLEH
jgi:3-deoxy-D-manno-octulosonic-acid transferase